MSPKELRDKVADMPSYIIDDDFIIYHRYIPLMREDILDLGTGWGKSVVAMALMNPQINITSIDDGSYPIYQRWAADEKAYEAKLKEEFKNHGVDNITLIISDLLSLQMTNATWQLIHFDLTREKEIEVLKAWLPKVSINGLALIRNFERLQADLGDLLDDFEYIDSAGLINVYRRIK